VITIVDYGMGNVGSIANMLRKIGVPSHISRDPAELDRAEKLVLPGVGAFDPAIERIEAYGLRPILEKKALRDRVPVLGICLGMQLLTESSEEGRRPGLAFIPARALALRDRIPANLKVPTMGWNLVHLNAPSPLTAGFEQIEEPRFYFVHSYFVRCAQPEHGILSATYGVTYDAGFQRDNIYGVQFHPEKSHRFGMRLLENFARL